MRHCCSVTPRLRSPGRKRLMTASRVRSKAIGNDSEKARIGSALRATGVCESSGDIIDHRVAQDADARYLDLDDISGYEITRRIQACAGAAGRSAQNHVARLQRTEGRQVADQIRNLEQHAVTGVVLPLLTVYARRH